MNVIPNKATYYRLWRAGVLGNRPKTWATADDLRASGYAQPIVMRSTQVGWKTLYGISVEEALRLAPGVQGATFNELLPDAEIVLQGEVMRTWRGLELTYSFAPYPMKIALAKAPCYAVGLVAKLLLDTWLWPASRDDVDAFLDLYDGHAIEFTAYGIAVGDQPHRNTLIWEVRRY
jgi:hypothetical protein